MWLILEAALWFSNVPTLQQILVLGIFFGGKVSPERKAHNRTATYDPTEEWRLLGCYAVWLL
jgi:hypothetical protein